jgi:hypothetical protein
VTSHHIDVGSDDVRVQVGFTSSYENQGEDDDLRITVALRDAGGTLLGAKWAQPDFPAGLAPGERQEVGSFRQSWWPDQADPDASQAMIVKVCCAWVGVA